jgi:uncharacterized protein
VVEVDVARKRISLTMRLNDNVSEQNSKVKQQTGNHKNKPNQQTANVKSQEPNQRKQHKPKVQKIDNAAMGNAFADAFAKLKK